MSGQFKENPEIRIKKKKIEMKLKNKKSRLLKIFDIDK